MSVNVEWKVGEEGRGGIVAEGTYLWDAAKRLGVRLPAECEGRGECDTCAVVVEEGATLLSRLTEAERTRLSPERLAAGERLACQSKVERGGNLVLRPVPVTERAETTEEAAKDLREEFRRMPLRKKFAALAGMEADMAYETLVRVVDIPFAVFGKGLDLLASRGRKLSQIEREGRRPAERRPAPSSGDKGPAEHPN
ncbi:MAG TPA: 2Fe-2S iron-sulfur cluster-binding protein [Pyrinomonadaceae bacterium]|jgi:ferredoxin|nr:2Fe-2S iron-sulfur cluster-binding protein [Pyrinomonadaceae bacterium]